MALIDKASLLMVPSTYEAGKLYNVLPSGNRAPDNKGGAGYDQTRADFDFDRGSNAAATRINSSGLIEKYRANELLNSNGFNDAVWTKKFSSVTSNKIGYDGSNDAWLIEKSAASGRVQQIQSGTGVQTFSVYAKAGTLNHMRLRAFSSSNPSCFFDFTDGSIHNNDGISATMTSVGGGWYRCSYSFVSSLIEVQIYPADSTSSVAGTTGSIYIQSAQQESGLVATDVLTSGATTAKAGVLVDLPRINFDANGENGALLLEPSRKQLIQFSEYFGASYWTKTGSSVVSGFTSPEGLSNAYKLVEDTSTGNHRLFTIATTTSAGYLSIYAKAGERTEVNIAGAVNEAYFNLSTGVVISETTAGIAKIDSLSNGWYRCSIKTTILTSNSINIYTSVGGSNSYTGDGTSGVYIFGAMLEQNATYPSSYIPNHGESGGVTRAADSCSVTGASDVIGQTEGTMYVEAKVTFSSRNGRIMLIGENNDFIELVGLSNGKVESFAYNGSVQAQIYSSSTYSSGDNLKIALAYKANDFVVYINGVQEGADTSGVIPSSMARIILNNYFAAGYNEANEYKQATLFNERLSNAELATLTTL